ncbi:hypothetical protein [Lentibacillus sp. Marseille-P4043]|uniref:hypothetical protein n=1 Tax=Lentibacillus sp. Marseille-P4043 TaxID=2040293 RepID=UPI000D0B5E1F|nr:hypothetical protein [Lentibacillus sp. Marseille-P4043]
MKLKKYILLLILIFIFSGCHNSNIPEGFSKEYYNDFVKSYELYEKRVKKYDGKFVDDNGELIDFEGDIFKDSDLLEVAWEDRKRKEDGKDIMYPWV